LAKEDSKKSSLRTEQGEQAIRDRQYQEAGIHVTATVV
jgi:hypothetical protein